MCGVASHLPRIGLYSGNWLQKTFAFPRAHKSLSGKYQQNETNRCRVPPISSGAGATEIPIVAWFSNAATTSGLRRVPLFWAEAKAAIAFFDRSTYGFKNGRY